MCPNLWDSDSNVEPCSVGIVVLILGCARRSRTICTCPPLDAAKSGVHPFSAGLFTSTLKVFVRSSRVPFEMQCRVVYIHVFLVYSRQYHLLLEVFVRS